MVVLMGEKRTGGGEGGSIGLLCHGSDRTETVKWRMVLKAQAT